MCGICHQHPCDSRCPNAPETNVACFCEGCDDPIKDGEWAYEFYENYYFCENCVEKMHKKVRI